MEAHAILDSLGVADAATRTRAGELERLLRPRTTAAALAQCRGAVSVLLACREHNQSVEPREVSMAGCVTVDQLLVALSACQRMLNLRFVAVAAACLCC